jgi:hypothetical protein
VYAAKSSPEHKRLVELTTGFAHIYIWYSRPGRYDTVIQLALGMYTMMIISCPTLFFPTVALGFRQFGLGLASVGGVGQRCQLTNQLFFVNKHANHIPPYTVLQGDASVLQPTAVKQVKCAMSVRIV